MLLSIAFLCFCVTLVAVRILLCFKPNTIKGNSLPGPTQLPLLGNFLQIGFRPHISFTKWAKIYGPIYKIKLGFKETVVVNDPKLIKDIFNETASTARLNENPVIMEFTKGPYGILNSSGSTWEAQRKFTMRTLRSLGFPKKSMETMKLDEVKIMLDWLKKQEGLPISGKRLFTAPVVNSLWRIISGERCQWEDGKPAISDVLDDFFKELMKVSSNGLFFAPFLISIAPNMFGWNRYVKSVDNLLRMFHKSIDKHKETFDSTELRDFTDHFLFQIGNETNSNSSFYKDTGNANLLAAHIDLFFGGAETTSNTLSFTLLYLSEHLNIQETLQKEIDQVIGSTLPSLSDRVNMPYCEAVISEILRITSTTPIGAPHVMTSDLVFYGYHIPKGATIFANIYGVHHDHKIWGDPETFRPERFLNENKTKFVRNEALIPFAEGRRKCIGDSFAMDTLFLFVTSIFQHFITLPDPNTEGNADLEADFGLMLAPKPFKIVVRSRKCE